MKFSISSLQEWIDLKPLGEASSLPTLLSECLTRRGLEVESVRRLDQGLDRVVVAKILEKKKHPEADRLSLCQVTTGDGGFSGEIVCGAQNMKAGDVVVLAQIGAELPNGIKIERSKIRGVVSNGMLCSAEELRLPQKSEKPTDGIIILAPETPLGTPLAQVLGLNDTILEVSLTPNRGDCMSLLGIAREIAAETGGEVKTPTVGSVSSIPKARIQTRCSAGEDAPRFLGCLIEGVRVGPSPEWVVRKLESLGSRGINNVVDATNLVMFELGQPVHAYDAALLKGTVVEVREAKTGESVKLIDGTNAKTRGGELVIADSERVLGLAGVMGGAETEVTGSTQNVYLECAWFAPARIRRTAKLHQLHSEASARFERGVDRKGLERAMGRLIYWVTELAGGRVAGSADASTAAWMKWEPRTIPWEANSAKEIATLLGMEVSAAQCERILNSLGCQFTSGHLTVPSYRNDVSTLEDLAEEIARTVGFDKIPSTLPIALTQAKIPASLERAYEEFSQLERARNALAECGLRESIHYAFASQGLLQKYGYRGTVEVLNPLSEVGETLCPSLLPHLLEAAQGNWNHHFGSEPLHVRLFQIRPTFERSVASAVADRNQDTGIVERWKVAFLISGATTPSAYKTDLKAVDFFDAKALVVAASEKLGIRGLRFRHVSEDKDPSPFHPGLCAEVWVGKTKAGYVGALHPRVALQEKVKSPVWLAELDWTGWMATALRPDEVRPFRMWTEAPLVERDFSLVLPEPGSSDAKSADPVTAEKILQLAVKTGQQWVQSARVFDYYREQPPKKMTSVAVRVIFSVDGRSILETEADEAARRIVEAWKKELGVQLR